MPDDNRLPTNQSQLDIEAALQDVKNAIANLNFILDAQNIAYDSNTSVKNKIDTKADSTYMPIYKRLLRLTSVQFNVPSDCMGFLLCRSYTGAGDQNCTIIPFGVAGSSAWVDNILVSGGVAKPSASYSNGVITFSWSSEQLSFVACYIAPMA